MIKYDYISMHADPANNREIHGETEEKAFYEEIAKLMVSEPNFQNGGIDIKVEVEGMGCVLYRICKRFKGSVIHQQENNLPSILNPEGEIKKYNTCVSEDETEFSDKNAYRFYEIQLLTGYNAARFWRTLPYETKSRLEAQGADGNGVVKVTTGRIQNNQSGTGKTKTYAYAPALFWAMYYEKTCMQGYTNQPLFYSAKPEKKEITIKTVQRNDTPSSELFSKLKEFASGAVKDSKIKVTVNAEIIAAAKNYVDKMRIAKTVEEFNGIVLNLIAILQRPVAAGNNDGVRKLTASSETDFEYIIQREESLIQAMEGSLSGTAVMSTGDFSEYGIEVYKATDKQRAEVMQKLSDELKPLVKNVYRVIPAKQKNKFNAYLEKNGIRKVQMLWHGSRNENWMSIIQNSLQLHPNAVVTGKMFGNGIYFAPSSMKSWGYTSCLGSYWAKGNSKTGYMGLYACAIGTPYDVSSWNSSTDWEGDMKRAGANCLYAHKGSMLKNDEIVFYSESAMLLNYIVEFAK